MNVDEFVRDHVHSFPLHLRELLKELVVRAHAAGMQAHALSELRATTEKADALLQQGLQQSTDDAWPVADAASQTYAAAVESAAKRRTSTRPPPKGGA